VNDTLYFTDLPKAENINWLGTIRQIQQHPNYKKNMRIGIVTDSNLDDHDLYNSRKKPVVGEEFLPEGFELIYATSDGKNKNGSLLNKFIFQCDEISHNYMNNMYISDKQIEELRKA
jgi:hypothetical protein